MKVGDYVRTKYGIIDQVIIEYNGYCASPSCNCKHVSCRQNYYDEDKIIKSSPNIIDLIEVGDYVNGYQVIEKPYIYHDVQFVSVDTQDSWNWGKGEIPIKNIKSIVTHEQFSQMEYRIGE